MTISAQDILQLLKGVQPVDLLGLTLLRRFQEHHPGFFPAVPSDEDLGEAILEFDNYLSNTAHLAARLESLAPVPASDGLHDYCL